MDSFHKIVKVLCADRPAAFPGEPFFSLNGQAPFSCRIGNASRAPGKGGTAKKLVFPHDFAYNYRKEREQTRFDRYRTR